MEKFKVLHVKIPFNLISAEILYSSNFSPDEREKSAVKPCTNEWQLPKFYKGLASTRYHTHTMYNSSNKNNKLKQNAKSAILKRADEKHKFDIQTLSHPCVS